jgi:hypothetical protein
VWFNEALTNLLFERKHGGHTQPTVANSPAILGQPPVSPATPQATTPVPEHSMSTTPVDHPTLVAEAATPTTVAPSLQPQLFTTTASNPFALRRTVGGAALAATPT